MKKLIIAFTLLLSATNSFAGISCSAVDNFTNAAAKIEKFKQNDGATILRASSALKINDQSLFNALITVNKEQISVVGGVLGQEVTESKSTLLKGQKLETSVVSGGGAGPVAVLTINCQNN